MPHWFTAVFPLIVVVATILVPLQISMFVDLPAADGSTNPGGLTGLLLFTQTQKILWPCAALILGSIVALVTMHEFLPEKLATLGRGAEASALPILNTSAVIGFGGVVQTTSVFATFTNLMLHTGLNPLVSVVISMNVLCGIVASASGGMGIWMPTLAQHYLDAGIPPEILHRVALPSWA